MFTSFSGFSIFFFTVSAILLIGIIFEEKFLKLEDRFDEYIERKRKEKKAQHARNFKFQQMQNSQKHSKPTNQNRNANQRSKKYAA